MTDEGINVVIVTDHALINGGVSQVAVQSARILSDAGVKVTVVFGVGPADHSIGNGRITLEDFGLDDLIANPNRLKAAVTGIWNGTASRGLASVLQAMDRRRTVIHFHGWTKSLSSSVISVALGQGFPVVVTLHDYFTTCPNGGFFNYQQRRSCHLTPMSLACMATHCDSRSYAHKLWRIVRQGVQQHIAKVPDRLTHFISVSKFSEDILRPHLPSHAEFHRVTNPIDIEKSRPAEPGSNQIFSYVGRLSAEKGPALLAQASLLAGVTTQFLGDGEERQHVYRLNPASQFLGWCNRKSVREHLSSSRAVVFPSLWYETQGMVTLEAAALGVPCIVSDACASREYVENGVSGLWFRSGDTEDLAEKLGVLSAHPETANAMGLEAYRRYWKTPHVDNRHLTELLACYKKVLSLS